MTSSNWFNKIHQLETSSCLEQKSAVATPNMGWPKHKQPWRMLGLLPSLYCTCPLACLVGQYEWSTQMDVGIVSTPWKENPGSGM